MINRFLLVLSLLMVATGLGMYAADAPKPTVPTIPAEIQAEVFATQLDAQLAREANDKAQALAQAAIAKGQASCGDTYTLLRLGTKLECVAKPEAKK